mgnify:CR=1 FL=1
MGEASSVAFSARATMSGERRRRSGSGGLEAAAAAAAGDELEASAALPARIEGARSIVSWRMEGRGMREKERDKRTASRMKKKHSRSLGLRRK